MYKKLTVALCLLASPLSAQTVSIETYRGHQDVPVTPGKIAVFDMAALDSLLALGIVPDATIHPVYVDYLAEATNNAAHVGTLFEPDYEAIAAIAPDLVIAGGRSYKAVPNLNKIAPTIDMTIWEDTVSQGLDRLEAYGEIFDKQAEAAALAQAFEAKVEATRKSTSGQGSALVVMTNGPKISAYGPEGRFGWLYDTVGLKPAVENIESSTHGEAISFEFIHDANPDVLIVIDRMAAIGQDGDAAQTVLDNALVQETKAWETGKVIYLDSTPLYIAAGGIQSMTLTLDQIAAAFEAD
ncbi:siderophore ABC transporter substrate-binding protein [Roseibium sp. RKSG952]|uniref:siderophore ABC transporter substrate-binding protein n=1 Tax=Roseibium sp. RKSG952 TaxID=2529384 RepID=UPI0012BBCF69|nr:siderophore ABC transporter substrate-binding protein [Roseibium sp. RKSG952]MTI02004.1 siderophore ABC transporter substrate-binding protein [Roseibium sp. RKSG952]